MFSTDDIILGWNDFNEQITIEVAKHEHLKAKHQIRLYLVSELIDVTI